MAPSLEELTLSVIALHGCTVVERLKEFTEISEHGVSSVLVLQLLGLSAPVDLVFEVLSDGTRQSSIGLEDGSLHSLGPEEACLYVAGGYLSVMEVVTGETEQSHACEWVNDRLDVHALQLTDLVALDELFLVPFTAHAPHAPGASTPLCGG